MDYEEIVAVAMKTEDGKVFVARNSHTELRMYPKEFINAEQGFLTSKDRFVDRKEALKIAKKRNQIIRKHGTDNELFSEDLFYLGYTYVKKEEIEKKIDDFFNNLIYVKDLEEMKNQLKEKLLEN